MKDLYQKPYLKILLLSIFTFLLFSYSSELKSKEKEPKKKSMYINYTVNIADEEMEDNNHIQFLEEFFSKEWEWDAFFPMLYQSDYMYVGFQDIYNNQKSYLYYKPNLIALTKLSNKKTLAKVAFATPDNNDFTSIMGIYDFLIIDTEDGLRLGSPFEYNLQNWNKLESNGNNYYTPKGRTFNLENISEMNNFNIKLSEYFDIPIIPFHYCVGRDIIEIKKLQGIDFNAYMYSNDGLGGEAYPWYNFIFSGNNSEYYPHELVHLYTYQLFPDKHSSMDEALAVYLGGALDKTFEDYMPALKAYILEHEVDLFDYAFQYIDKYITIKQKPIGDLILAFLCYYTEKEYDKEVLFELMNSGRTYAELLVVLEESVGLNKENFNTIIKQELISDF